MTTKERLVEAIGRLSDEQAEDLLRLVDGVYFTPRQRPSWVGAFHSGRGDLSENYKQILRDELGGSR